MTTPSPSLDKVYQENYMESSFHVKKVEVQKPIIQQVPIVQEAKVIQQVEQPEVPVAQQTPAVIVGQS